MYGVMQQGSVVQNYLMKFVCDKLADKDNLPKSAAAGSTCFVIEDGSRWILGNDKKWYPMSCGSGSGSGSGGSGSGSGGGSSQDYEFMTKEDIDNMFG